MELEGNYLLNDEDLNQYSLQSNKHKIERNRTIENGCLKYDDCDVYSYKLATLFSSNELNLYERNSSSIKQIIGWELIDIYQAAYKDGLKHFDNLFPSINLYGEHSELIIDSLHQHCYHTRHDEHGFNRPWMDILFKEPYSLSSKILVTYGFYSGILSKVYYLANNFKAVFDKYDTGKNCAICKTENLAASTNLKTDIDSPQKRPINILEDAVINDNALNKIYNLLIEAKLIDKDTKILKDKTGGYKGHFYSSIILFNEKGYFKRQPNKSEYLNICNNTFKVDIKESTARNHKTRQRSTLTIPPFIPID